MSDLLQQQLPSLAGFDVHHLPVVDSTNVFAARLIAEGAADRVAVLADRQISGRGRQGRQWLSPPGNLFLSLVWADAPALGSLWSLVTGIVVVEAVKHYIPHEAVLLKWPNDIMVRDSKLGGILIERSAPDFPMVIGIGINIIEAPYIAHRSVIALNELCSDCAAVDTAVMICQKFDAWRARLASVLDPHTLVIQHWQNHAWGIGLRASWAAGQQYIDGYARGIDPDGAFVIEDDHGIRHRVLAGEVGFHAAHD